MLSNLSYATLFLFQCLVLSSTFEVFNQVRAKAHKNVHNILQSSMTENNLGAPRVRPESGKYITKNNVQVQFEVEDIMDINTEVNTLIDRLDNEHGICNPSLV